MLTPEYLDKLPDKVVERYSDLEIRILEDMARRIVKMGKLTDTAQWQLWKLEQVGAEREFIQYHLQRLTGMTQGEIAGILEEAGEKAISYDDQIYRKAGLNPAAVAKSEALKKVIQAGMKKTMRLFFNLTSTTANTASKQFENALDTAYMDVISGAFSYQEAIRKAVKTLAANGIDAIQYPSGHTDKMDVAVRRAVLTGVNQTAAEMQISRMDEMDCDLVETTAHAGARPSHAAWQGKIFSRNGRSSRYPPFSKTGYGTGPGLCGWNCRHSFFPFFEGLSKEAYSRTELSAMNKKSVVYNGKQYTDYEASQIQRNIERNIRKWKREFIALDAAELDTSEASARLASWRAAQKDFLEQTGRREDNFRGQVEGFGRSQAAKARTEAEWLKKYGKDGMIEAEIRKTGVCQKGAQIHLTPQKIDVEKLGFDDEHINNESLHHVTEQQAKQWIQEASISVTVWGGWYERYYGKNGSVYIDMRGEFIRTAYSAKEYDDKVKALMEVLKKYEY